MFSICLPVCQGNTDFPLPLMFKNKSSYIFQFAVIQFYDTTFCVTFYNMNAPLILEVIHKHVNIEK